MGRMELIRQMKIEKKKDNQLNFNLSKYLSYLVNTLILSIQFEN